MGVHRRRLAVAVAAGLAVINLGGGCAATGDAPGAAGTGPLHAAPTGGAVGTQAVVDAKGGPLSAADRELLVKVRQAGLWEIPVGREAARRAALPVTRKMLGGLADQHVALDNDVRAVAARLRVPLPDQASEEQQGFVKEIFGKSGKAFDRTAVKRLRIAHGNVLPFIGQVRGSTQNKIIRDFAERAAKFVLGHINMLEDTGLVDAAALPPAPAVTGTPDVVVSGPFRKARPAASVLGSDGLPNASAADGPQPGGDALVKAKGGPLSAADRELLVKVRQAGLWEIPVGREAAKRAALPATRRHLGMLGGQHVALDNDVRAVAARLRVPLPDKASEEQQGFVKEIFGKSGKAFDRTAVKRLRIAHGNVFPLIHRVRATTQNRHIRDFAERAAKFVNGHMDMLEATGLVNAAALPPPPESGGAPDVVPAGRRFTPAPPAGTLIDVSETEFGPLNAADRDLLVKVRQAGLWEIPVGREAERRAARAATRKNLGEIARQHVELDADVISVAARLGVPLPNEPTDEQKGFVTEIFGKSGKEFDVVAVKRLRIAHGKVFPFIAQVRATTRNTLIREFAQRASVFVNTHMTLLEDTGLAGAHALPPPPEVSGAPPVSSGGPAPSAPPATSLPLPGLGGSDGSGGSDGFGGHGGHGGDPAADAFTGGGDALGDEFLGEDYLGAGHSVHGSGH
jgi:predicted outer membrane protein